MRSNALRRRLILNTVSEAMIIPALLQVDIEKHNADTADRCARGRHIEIGEVKSQNIGEKRYGIHPKGGNIADKRADVPEQC